MGATVAPGARVVPLPSNAPAHANTTSEPAPRGEVANKGLGLASRARTSAASAPPLAQIGKRATTTAAALREVEGALEGATAPEIESRLTAIGFELDLDQPKSGARYLRGGLELRVDSRALGPEIAVELEVSAKHQETRHAVQFGGISMSGDLFNHLAGRYAEEIAAFEDAAGERRRSKLPTTLDELKAFIAAGESRAEQAKEKAQAQEIDEALAGLSARLQALAAEGRAPKGIIIYTDGPDGAGKSSTGAIVMQALEDAGYANRSETFKAPTQEEKKQHWLQRFLRGVPKTGEAVFWDRGPAGDFVYGTPSASATKKMARDFAGFDKNLAADGILFFKIELFADRERQAETFGKRLARRHISERIRQVLSARGELDAPRAATLDTIAGKIDDADFRAFAAYDGIQSRYMDVINKTGGATRWNLIDATKRHDARLALIERLDTALETFGTRQG